MRAMAKQAEAEREKRSKIIHAEGEFSAAQRLVDAAHLLQTEPASIQLRYLQTLAEIGVEKNTTVIFPVPIDLLAGIQKTNGECAKIHTSSQRRRAQDRGIIGSRRICGSRNRWPREGRDTEITLGMGKLLGLFFGLVILCGISLAWVTRWDAIPQSRAAAAGLRSHGSRNPGTPRLRRQTSPERRRWPRRRRRIAPRGDNCPTQSAARRPDQRPDFLRHGATEGCASAT